MKPISQLKSLQKFGIYHKRPIVEMNDFATVDSKLSKLKYVCWQTAEYNNGWISADNDHFDREYMGTGEEEQLYIDELNAKRISVGYTSIKVTLWTPRQWNKL